MLDPGKVDLFFNSYLICVQAGGHILHYSLLANANATHVQQIYSAAVWQLRCQVSNEAGVDDKQ